MWMEIRWAMSFIVSGPDCRYLLVICFHWCYYGYMDVSADLLAMNLIWRDLPQPLPWSAGLERGSAGLICRWGWGIVYWYVNMFINVLILRTNRHFLAKFIANQGLTVLWFCFFPEEKGELTKCISKKYCVNCAIVIWRFFDSRKLQAHAI